MLQEILEVYNFIHRRDLRIPRRGICGGQRILGGAEHTFIVSKLAASVCVRARLPACARVGARSQVRLLGNYYFLCYLPPPLSSLLFLSPLVSVIEL